MRLIVHAGFHKTGTTSVQQTLDANRAALAPALRVMLKDDMKGMTEAARAYSRTQDEVEWALYLYETRAVFEALDPTDPRPVLMSSEDLSGHMPFRHALPDYGAAPRLVRGLAEVAEAVHPGARIEFVFTTRAATPWVRSCWAQHVRAVQFTEDLDTYTARALPHADLDRMTDRIADAVLSHAVHRKRLEDVGDMPLGPLDPLLDIVGLPAEVRAAVQPQPRANPSMPEEVLRRLLKLNRSDRPWSEVKEEKKRIVRKAKRAAA
ncbi:hypothetical protein [Oceanicola sp. 22II-s10i]|uniref:hypothetical protein n=1 Tax=Oceanicola sp. 22II-s10i TaxID=1317116 RepID=UPI000B522FAB|nr:hypothetical protein [Oceanicola sp. 22II-s10i]